VTPRSTPRRGVALAGVLLLVSSFVGLSAVSASSDVHSGSPATYTVLVGLSQPGQGVNVDAYFPDTLKVHVGDTVNFKDNAAEIHTVTFLAPHQTLPDFLATFPLLDPAVWRPVVPANHLYDGTSYANSGIMSTDPSFSLPGQQVTSFWLRFTHAGSYQYFCIVHGVMMTGTINVVDPSARIPSPGQVRHQVKKTIAGLLKQVPAAIDAAWAAIMPPVHNSDGTTTYHVNVGFMYGMIDLMSFFPGKLRVHPGDTVVWHMTTVPHTITFLNGNPEPSLLVPATWPPTSGPTVMFNPAILGPSASVVGGQALNKTEMFHSGFLPVPDTTFSLTIGASIIWLFFGIAVGVISAITAGRLSDRIITVLALVGISMPVFWLGIIARYYLAEGGLTTFFPDGEYVGLTASPVSWFSHLIVPWLVLAVLFIGFYGRVLRGNILDTINEDFVRTAKAKGLPPRQILLRHVLRTSLIPVLTLFGLDFAAVLGGGAILTETVFDLHGVGQYAAQSINNFDLPPIMGVTMYGAFFIVVFSVLVDLFYAYLDPRIRPT